MIVLRFACLLAGLLVLIVPPALLYPGRDFEAGMAGTGAMLVALLLASAGFFLIGMAGHRIRRSASLRRLCALLLAPFLAGAAMLWRGVDPLALWMSGALLGFTLIVALFLAAMQIQGPSPRRLRARELPRRQEPVWRQLG